MSERYWKEREGDEFFDDYIDVTDEVAALRAELADYKAGLSATEGILAKVKADRASLNAERDELLSRAREMDDAIARNMLRGDIAEAERDRYRVALEDARHIATTGVWDRDPAHCYEDQIIEAIASVIDTALNGGDDE